MYLKACLVRFMLPLRVAPASGGSGLDLGRVEEPLLAPYQPRLEALLHDPLEEAPEHLKPVALPDPGEAGVVGQRFAEIVSEVPANAKAVGHHPHQLPFGAQILEKEDELELKENHWIY